MAQSPVDLDHLDRYTGGDIALNAEILRLFDHQAGELIARLNAVLEAKDAKSWAEIAHALKGAALGIGAFAFADAAANAEPINPAHDGEARPALAALRAQALRVTEFIRGYPGS